ncbi:MAG TPA: xanthine dehydrogenase family protein subunit M [Thermoanaerobaculia bacterium]|jgi:xanthine dehydrogenase YagS FAD-binding subunit|nr:xanthine dehydrogenase family protein subunit M [Thermoanaerobaculia bacterium]
MQPFDYSHPATLANAMTSGGRESAKFLAGGTNLVDLMKCNVEQPAHVVDINGLGLATIEQAGGGIRIGALARMSDVAASPLVRDRAPAISQALLASASPQLRNAASIGGNLMQRTRCPYFRELTWTPCNKRDPGSGCSALEGENRMHAILGTSEQCIATHPSDLAVAVAALDGVLTLRGPAGERQVAAVDFHLLPGSTPQREHALEHGELITSVFIPDAPHARHSAYLKVRDRASYEFALTSAAVGVEIANGAIRSARVALGGVGTKPWRARLAEATLIGKEPSADVFRNAAEAELKQARGYGQNDFKIELAKRTLVRALSDLAGGAA